MSTVLTDERIKDICNASGFGEAGFTLRFARAIEREVAAQADCVAIPSGFVWPEPPSGGQSDVLFDDGYAEGWAKAIDTVRNMFAAAPPKEVAK